MISLLFGDDDGISSIKPLGDKILDFGNTLSKIYIGLGFSANFANTDPFSAKMWEN